MAEILTSVEAVLALPVNSIVDTGVHRRERTHKADEWDMVLDSAEVLEEGGGIVTVIYRGRPW